jgi:hypothetical protein
MRLFPIIVVLLLAGLLYWWFTRTPPEQVARTLKRALLWIGGGLLIVLAATGRLPALFALLGALAPFVQRIMRLLSLWPLIQRVIGLFGGARQPGGASARQSSRVRTVYLDMLLDHDSGAMSGTILRGRFAGSALADLSLAQLLELLDECRKQDSQSAAILEAYMDRELDESWRERDPAGENARAAPTSSEMSIQQAYEILGLESGASDAEVIAAHRRLMQKLHPDRGGSTYLAAQINRAKEILQKHAA